MPDLNPSEQSSKTLEIGKDRTKLAILEILGFDPKAKISVDSPHDVEMWVGSKLQQKLKIVLSNRLKVLLNRVAKSPQQVPGYGPSRVVRDRIKCHLDKIEPFLLLFSPL